ncbi:pyridoxamine 5'-phosphate oxidase family protein [Herbiconiux sp. 11R-BC]|uniref:pyridoxamine 5'-phosphate oxidase family protein n=1 Tax=Herbiconiux sp. 11R-BC TaxID=3111637 RepID=UPI003C0F31F3
MTDNTHDDDIQTIAKLISAAKVALVTSQTASGELHSRPLAVQEKEFDGVLWFFTPDPSEKTAEIAAHPKVNAAFESGKGYLSISGTASVVHDRATIDELWSAGVEAWFPEGKDDPSVALLRVDAESAEFWSTGQPRLVTALKIAAAAATGHQPDVGENRTTAL